MRIGSNPEEFPPWLALSTTTTGTGTGRPFRDKRRGEMTTDMMRRRMRMKKVRGDTVGQRSLHPVTALFVNEKLGANFVRCGSLETTVRF
jgi:hypothetical protein